MALGEKETDGKTSLSARSFSFRPSEWELGLDHKYLEGEFNPVPVLFLPVAFSCCFVVFILHVLWVYILHLKLFRSFDSHCRVVFEMHLNSFKTKKKKSISDVNSKPVLS